MSELAAPDLVSPELALVCPTLRAEARASLPERDPYAFLPSASGAARRLTARVVVAVSLAYVVTQVLLLVSAGILVTSTLVSALTFLADAT